MDIVTRSEWGARYADGFRNRALPASEVWLHHSVTTAPTNPDAAAVRTLERIGQDRFGAGISYTFAVTPNGTVYHGHSPHRQGAHTGGRNTIASAICLVGNYDTARPTEAQLDAVADLLRHGKAEGWWTAARLNGGHRDAPGASTACPGRHAYAAIAEINRRASVAPVTPTPVPTRKEPNVLENHPIAPGRGVLRLNVSVSAQSVALEAAWIIASVNGPDTGTAHLWFQRDAAGISEADHTIGFTEGRSEREVTQVPDGTTMVNIHYDFPDGGCITVEGKSK